MRDLAFTGRVATLLLALACVTPLTPKERQVQAWASDYLAREPVEAVRSRCRIGVYLNGLGIVNALGPNAGGAGVARGDRIVAVDGAPVRSAPEIGRALSSHGSSRPVRIAVERGGQRRELTVDCLDGTQGERLRRQVAEAALERRWRDCMSLTLALEALEGHTAELAHKRLECYEAGRPPDHRRPSLEHARLVFEAKSRAIDQMAYSPDDIAEGRGDILATVSWLEGWRYTKLAHDLRGQLASATSHANRVAAQRPASSPAASQEQFSTAVSHGTCFVVHPHGLLLTAHHVVAGARRISVRLADGRESHARVEQAAAANDLALLRIDETTPSYLSLAPPRSTSSGQSVFTLGFPIRSLLGEEPKFTDGAISSLSGVLGEASLLQTTVPLQPGSSGGPLANDRGEVVGIVTSTAAIERFLAETGSLPQSINWAVKADYARPLFDPPAPLPTTPGREAAIERVRRALCSVEATSR